MRFKCFRLHLKSLALSTDCKLLDYISSAYIVFSSSLWIKCSRSAPFWPSSLSHFHSNSLFKKLCPVNSVSPPSHTHSSTAFMIRNHFHFFSSQFECHFIRGISPNSKNKANFSLNAPIKPYNNLFKNLYPFLVILAHTRDGITSEFVAGSTSEHASTQHLS